MRTIAGFATTNDGARTTPRSRRCLRSPVLVSHLMAGTGKVRDHMRKLFDAMSRHALDACDKVAVSDSERVIHRGELLARVIGLAADITTQSGTIGILAPNGIDWVIAQLACALAGKIAVPLPTFFSPAPLGYLVRSASVGLILTTDQTKPLAVQSGVETSLISAHAAAVGLSDPADGFGQII